MAHRLTHFIVLAVTILCFGGVLGSGCSKSGDATGDSVGVSDGADIQTGADGSTSDIPIIGGPDLADVGSDDTLTGGEDSIVLDSSNPKDQFCGNTFTVTVLQAGGSPQVGALVQNLTDSSKKGVTNSQGRVTLPLAAGTWVVTLFGQEVTGHFGPLEDCDAIELTIKSALSKGIKLAVIKGEYDSVEDVLAQMGFVKGENLILYSNVWNKNISDSLYHLFYPSGSDEPTDQILKGYHAVFFNCGSYTWSGSSTEMLSDQKAMSMLLQYVEEGGKMYVSDWAYFHFIEYHWPGVADWALTGADLESTPLNQVKVNAPKIGSKQLLTASVKDTKLSVALGKSQVQINFDFTIWVVIDAVDAQTDVLIEAPVKTTDGMTLTVRPLMFRRQLKKGRILYTSFHNESQATGDMIEILKLVLASF